MISQVNTIIIKYLYAEYCEHLITAIAKNLYFFASGKHKKRLFVSVFGLSCNSGNKMVPLIKSL